MARFTSKSCLPALVLTAMAGLAAHVLGDTPSLLQQLSDDTQRVYSQTRHSMVRVQLPLPQWLEEISQRQQLLDKWGPKLDPVVRQKLIEEQQRALAGLQHPASTEPSTEPSVRLSSSTAPMTQPSITQPAAARSAAGLALFAVGLLVDDQGHAVFPVFVDRKFIGEAKLPAMTGDGHLTTARFVGSDAKTNLTVLQLEDHSGVAAPLGHSPPEDGSLTLVISREGGARLVVWTAQHPEPGFAVLPDASIAGFGFDNHFLGASTAKPIVDQLISTGEVHRAFLGVRIAEVAKDDPFRRQHVELGNSPAIRIIAVQNDSPAAMGGIQPDDLVLSIGDQAVGDAPTFAAVIAARNGQTTLHILRGSRAIELTVNLQPR